MHNLKKLTGLFAGTVILTAAYYISTQNYLLFHALTEVFTIAVSFSIAIIVFNNRHNLKNDYIKILGVAFAFAGGFDLLHTLSYKGMGVFTSVSTRLATETWLIARFMDSIGMLVAGLSFYRSINPSRVMAAFCLMALAALAAVYWQLFPVTFVEGKGLTPFKVYSEYLISLILVASMLLLLRRKAEFHPKVFRWLMFFYLASIGTELAFTTYYEVYAWQNMVGHLLKIIAFFCLYRAIVETSLKEPFNSLFFQLNRAHDMLKANEIQLMETQRLAKVGSWEWDLIKNDTRWSDQTFINLGYAARQFTPTAASLLLRVHPLDRPRVEQAVFDFMAKDSYDLDFRIIKPNGEEGWIHVQCHTIFDNAGNPVRLFGALQDITESKRNEDKLQRFAAELAEANKEVKSFANIVAHDLRAPLVNLKGFSRELEQSLDDVKAIVQSSACHMADVCQNEVVAILERDMPESLNFINSSVDRMDRMIAGLLKLSRMGRRELTYQEVDMGELVNSVTRSFKHQIADKGIELKVDHLPQIDVDYLAMEQIVSNLLDNAIKYLEPGRAGKIEISCVSGETETVFSIRDNGRGIAADELEQVFEIFRRAGSRDVPGEGMGLAYVRTLIRQLGGRVWCESKLGVGTTMFFAVPKRPLSE